MFSRIFQRIFIIRYNNAHHSAAKFVCIYCDPSNKNVPQPFHCLLVWFFLHCQVVATFMSRRSCPKVHVAYELSGQKGQMGVNK